jgi:hypothetical protein
LYAVADFLSVESLEIAEERVRPDKNNIFGQVAGWNLQRLFRKISMKNYGRDVKILAFILYP